MIKWSIPFDFVAYVLEVPRLLFSKSDTMTWRPTDITEIKYSSTSRLNLTALAQESDTRLAPLFGGSIESYKAACRSGNLPPSSFRFQTNQLAPPPSFQLLSFTLVIGISLLFIPIHLRICFTMPLLLAATIPSLIRGFKQWMELMRSML